MEILSDEAYMRMAMNMAEAARGQTGINPAVGCVIVKNGRVVGMGTHVKRGGPHAEINALQMAGSEARGSTVYVTLEPCSHYGKTPPCSDRLISEEVERVVVAAKDPNPLVAGTGIERLRQHGIQVDVGILEEESCRLNEVFNKYILTRMPFVTMKSASTLDGKLASRNGDSKWISGESSRERVHMLRHLHQAIMVGVETVLQDDPLLTSRLSVPTLQPLRIIIDSKLRTPITAKAVQDQTAKTLIFSTQRASLEKIMEFSRYGVEVIRCGDGEQVDLKEAMRKLGELEIGSVLLEGGGKLNGSMLELRLIDKIILFVAPKIVGGRDAPDSFTFSGFERMSEAVKLDRMEMEQVGEDVCITGYPNYGEEVLPCSPESSKK